MKKKLILFALAVFAFQACKNKESSDLSDGKTDKIVAAAPMAMESREAKNEEGAQSATDLGADQFTPPGTDGEMAPTPLPANKKLIKNADLRLQVERPEAARQNIEKMLPRFRAYLGNENTSNSPSFREVNLTLRVPAANFDALLRELLKQEGFLEQKTITVDDVTEEYVDIESRLRTKKAVEARYLGILQNAHTIKDILAVENELRVIREEIEAREGRLKYLNDQVGYSTIQLHLVHNIENPAAPQYGFWGKMAHALGSGWEGMLSFLVFAVTIWPFWLLLGGILWLVRYLKRRNAVPKA